MLNFMIRIRKQFNAIYVGSDEGVHAWVVANYALGTLGGDPHETTGIIELGGASAQVLYSSFFAIFPITHYFYCDYCS